MNIGYLSAEHFDRAHGEGLSQEQLYNACRERDFAHAHGEGASIDELYNTKINHIPKDLFNGDAGISGFFKSSGTMGEYYMKPFEDE